MAQLLFERCQLPTSAGQHARIGLQQGVLALDTLFDALQVRTQGRAPRLDQLLLILHLLLNQRVCHRSLQVRVKHDGGSTRLLGQQPPLDRPQTQVPLADRLVVGFGHRVIQRYQRLPRLHHVTLAHKDLLDDAPAEVLHRFAFGVDRNHALTGHPLVQGSNSRPQQKSPQAQAQHPQPSARRTPGIRGRQGRRSGSRQ